MMKLQPVRRSSFVRVAALSAVVLLAGCAASGPKMSETQIPALNASQGRIYFYRVNGMVGAAVQPDIRLNGKVVGESKPGGFFYVDSAPGTMEVATTTEVEKKLTFQLDAGQTRYVRTYVTFGVAVGRVQAELVDNAAAAQAIADTAYTGTVATKR